MPSPFFLFLKGGVKMNIEESDPQYLVELEQRVGLRSVNGDIYGDQLSQRLNHPKLIKWFKEKAMRSSKKRFVLGVKIYGLRDLVITEESEYLPDLIRAYEKTPISVNGSPRLIFDQESEKVLMTQNDQLIYETLLIIYSDYWWKKRNPLSSNYHNWHWRKYPVVYRKP